MAKITKDQIATLTGLDDNTRAEIAALFSDIEERDGQIATLKKKETDSDLVVAKNRELSDLNKKQEEQIGLLNGKMTELLGKSKAPVLTSDSDSFMAWSPFKTFFEGFHDDNETQAPNP